MRAVFLLVGLVGCYSAAPKQTPILPPGDAVSAWNLLRSSEGPVRFAQVTEQLYRGGQPTPAQVKLLHQLGVRTIVCLRSKNSDSLAEEQQARALGIRYVRLPFSALGTPDETLLQKIVDEVKAASGAVYVHCAAGRDRTSLIVALYRVWVQNWDPKVAWQREAVDFGHGAIWFRGLDDTFARLTGS